MATDFHNAMRAAGALTAPGDRGEATPHAPVKASARGIDLWYGEVQALFDVSLDIPDKGVTALIGPSGSGKSSFLRTLNRMNEVMPGVRTSGRVEIDGEDIYAPAVDPVLVRARVGMVFQRPNPFPKSIYDNVAYGARLHGLAKGRDALDTLVADALHAAGLWSEVAHRLHTPALALTDAQQQRLVIARALALQPEIILMDEPSSALDPVATARIEELIDELAQKVCIVIVTHSMAQAARVSHKTAFFHEGRLIEAASTEEIFTNPRDARTHDFITGRFG